MQFHINSQNAMTEPNEALFICRRSQCFRSRAQLMISSHSGSAFAGAVASLIR